MAERALITQTPEVRGEATSSRLQKAKHTRSIKHSALQAKLLIGQPDDIYEQEADRVAEQVMRMPDPVLQRKCPRCDEDEKSVLQTKKLTGHAPLTLGQDAPSIVQDVLNSPGSPLDSATRAYMEPRFGYDFSGVRVHTDTKAIESAHLVNALAFTVGRNVIFGANQYFPGSMEGRWLLGHELTHVVQQSRDSKTISPFQSVLLEQNAQKGASAIKRHVPWIGVQGSSTLRIARAPGPVERDVPRLRHNGLTTSEIKLLNEVRSRLVAPNERSNAIVGVLITEDGSQFEFKSGGGQGFSSHIEGKATAKMEELGITKATLLVEKEPCQICDRSVYPMETGPETPLKSSRTGKPIDRQISKINTALRVSSELTVVDPESASTYRGVKPMPSQTVLGSEGSGLRGDMPKATVKTEPLFSSGKEPSSQAATPSSSVEVSSSVRFPVSSPEESTPPVFILGPSGKPVSENNPEVSPGASPGVRVVAGGVGIIAVINEILGGINRARSAQQNNIDIGYAQLAFWKRFGASPTPGVWDLVGQHPLPPETTPTTSLFGSPSFPYVVDINVDGLRSNLPGMINNYKDFLYFIDAAKTLGNIQEDPLMPDYPNSEQRAESRRYYAWVSSPDRANRHRYDITDVILQVRNATLGELDVAKREQTRKLSPERQSNIFRLKSGAETRIYRSAGGGQPILTSQQLFGPDPWVRTIGQQKDVGGWFTKDIRVLVVPANADAQRAALVSGYWVKQPIEDTFDEVRKSGRPILDRQPAEGRLNSFVAGPEPDSNSRFGETRYYRHSDPDVRWTIAMGELRQFWVKVSELEPVSRTGIAAYTH